MFKNWKKENPGSSEVDKDKYDIPRENSEARLRQVLENESIDTKYGFKRLDPYEQRIGFLLNMHSNELLDEDKTLVAVVDYYFMEEDGTRFKISYPFKPYFYILTYKELLHEVTQFLSKKYSGIIYQIENVLKEDLDLPNHLIGLKQQYLKLSFLNETNFKKVRRDISSYVKKNKMKEKENSYYNMLLTNAIYQEDDAEHSKLNVTCLDNILDMREYDVPFHVRVSTDLKIFCGSWYKVKSDQLASDTPQIISCPELIERPEPIVLAFDIETTKLPLKFPDSNLDQIMMISYMIDGLGYLITNREIISQDINNFEFTPKPEFQGRFVIYNEPNEQALIKKFFDHVMTVRPHIFVTYNGDFFDWPFIESRAAIYDLDMKQEIGFFKAREGVYSCRPAIHMDCLYWVKRDSYLPQGSQGLKAVAKAKLRYDPVELDPEEMCPLAASQPQVLSNYSVSDAVATYYLYMQYVHPFIFALCTIIPCEPEEVLRKGSGTLCESILMVQAYHKNIVFPNKQEQILNKLTEDGHLLHQETYVGGHVEALESGVFRADIPCRFRIDVEAVNKLIEDIERTLTHAIEVEEGIPMGDVLDLEDIKKELETKLKTLKEKPLRLENPLIYHLDVGAMYPNIILTNRLQPCAIVNEQTCAVCDFNKPNAKCQRKMEWIWRGEMMPATRNEYFRIKQQLETEKFPPLYPNGPQRAFHELPREEQAEIEKKRMANYCRKVYKKQKVIKTEKITSTTCQKENSFYVDVVRAFRDRRYDYKALSKQAKKMVTDAIKGGNATDIKSAKNREVLYDSLQLAHKCILNSFYGYVMRRGARWHSMEMAGIVCYTGANIIMRAREIIEKIGRPLELDTDGIWCILPASFPENIVIHTSNEKKKKLIISYPNAILNMMVKEYFTNDQYHELVDPDHMKYEMRNENTIFFEVDGPYKAMVLPASKEEGKKLKKRYAVFNFDGSLAELKGFEVKRRGELQLIKNFQSSVFDAFLKGDSLQTCYSAVAQVANYWLDVLYSHGKYMHDSELFELISENKSMSRKLEDYGEQKSTSISTAKRLAEFLGDQMVKDAGLACKYVIVKKPHGAPVTERAIPLAIFQGDEEVQKYFLRKWLKDSSLNSTDIREILDWNYYIERLGGSIQKIITIPAAMQGVANPVPRVRHPEWLHKRILDKEDNFKQRKITDIFAVRRFNEKDNDLMDIEDVGSSKSTLSSVKKVVTITKRKRQSEVGEEYQESDYGKSWREVLGPPPPLKNSTESVKKWIEFQKKKWRFMTLQQNNGEKEPKRCKQRKTGAIKSGSTLGGFIQRAQRTKLTSYWQIIQILPTASPGLFKMWVLINTELYQLQLNIPRIFYVNYRTINDKIDLNNFQKCNRTLPRSKPVFNLFRCSVSEPTFLENGRRKYVDQSDPNVEGIYELQVPLLFRALTLIGCVCRVLPDSSTKDSSSNVFNLEKLEMTTISNQPYLKDDCLKHLFLYQSCSANKSKQMFGLFINPLKKSIIVVVDTVRTNLMPHMSNLYLTELKAKIEKINRDEFKLPPEEMKFEIRIETELQNAYKLIQKVLGAYKDEKKGPTVVAVQSEDELHYLQSKINNLQEYPTMQIHIKDTDDLYSSLEWQKINAKALIRHYLNSEEAIRLTIEQCRYFHLPVGNVPSDLALFGSDLMYARHLIKQNHVLWCSLSEKPDLGGSEENDARLLSESKEGSSEVCNNPGWYSTVCVELAIDSLAINTLLQSHHLSNIEGISSNVAFDSTPQSLDGIMNNQNSFTPYDDSSKCAEAFRILKIIVTAWMRDITLYRNYFADSQVVHFYRWLRTTKALLFDPALLRTLQNLMKKLFLQLVAEFQRLGCFVVYANFDKILICTKKRTVKDAAANIEYVVGSIRNRELFHSLEITYRQFWEQLVWLDSANYGGIVGKLPKGLDSECGLAEELDNIEQEDLEEGGSDEPMVVMHWNIAEQLPEIADCQKKFKVILAGYINAIYVKIKETKNVNDSIMIQSSQPSSGLTGYKIVSEYARELIIGQISQNLFSAVETLNKLLPVSDRGKSLATLHFINSICQVLGLDPTVKDIVDDLKCDLLRLVSVGEFSEEATFKDKTVSYVIPQIICKSCNHCRDVDLGRDNHRDETCWLCPLCNSPYDNYEIETQLLDTVTRKLISYNLQDLQCKKCSQIKLENLIGRCDCAGEFRNLISANDLIRLLETFQHLSINYNMPALSETVKNILSLV